MPKPKPTKPHAGAVPESDTWPGKEQGKWSPDALAITDGFFAWFRKWDAERLARHLEWDTKRNAKT